MSFDDTSVKVWIVKSFKATRVAEGVRDSKLRHIERAFIWLKAKRNEPGMSLQLHLAAAEWYMLCRHLVGSGKVSSFQMKTMIVGYASQKLIAQALGQEKMTRHNPKNPASKYSAGVIRWAEKGTDWGVKDNAALSATRPPYWRPVNHIMADVLYLVSMPGTTYDRP